MKNQGILGFSLAVLAGIGCVEIGQRPPVYQDRPIRTGKVEIPTKGAFAQFGSGSVDTVLVLSRACDVLESSVVHRTTTIENFNEQPSSTWLSAGAGVVSAGVGTALLMNPGPKPADDTKFTRTDWGVVLVGTGAVLTTIAVVDALRATGSETSEEQTELRGRTLRRGVKCTDHPIGNAEVTAVVPNGSHRLPDENGVGLEVEVERTINLGMTDPSGRIAFNVDDVFPEDVVLHKATKAQLVAGGFPAGYLDLSKLYETRRARAWTKAAPNECKNPTHSNSCFKLAVFAADFPDEENAQAIIKKSESAIAAFRDDETWSKVTAKQCAGADARTPDQVVDACKPVNAYLNQYPEGRHAAEANLALEKGQAVIDGFNAERQKQWQADQNKAAAKERNRCIGECKVICSHWKFAGAPQCIPGCIQKCNAEN